MSLDTFVACCMCLLAGVLIGVALAVGRYEARVRAAAGLAPSVGPPPTPPPPPGATARYYAAPVPRVPSHGDYWN